MAAAGVECQVGIADQLSTAVFAARAGRVVAPGEDARFLSALSIRQLATEPSLSGPGREELADLLWRLGIRTLGQFAALSRSDVASRFGADAVTAHRFARGEPERGPSGREPPAELDAVLHPDPPIDRVDAAAFAGRSLAAALHQALMSAGVGCTRLAIHAVTANGEELQRVWRCAEPLTEDATADRVRWQLDGWLNRRTVEDRPTAPVTQLRLQAVEVVSAGRCSCHCGVVSARTTGCGPDGRWCGCRACSVRRRCRCRCCPAVAGPPSASRSHRWATSRCRRPTRAGPGRGSCLNRRRRCCSTTRWNCLIPKAIRSG